MDEKEVEESAMRIIKGVQKMERRNDTGGLFIHYQLGEDNGHQVWRMFTTTEEVIPDEPADLQPGQRLAMIAVVVDEDDGEEKYFLAIDVFQGEEDREKGVMWYYPWSLSEDLLAYLIFEYLIHDNLAPEHPSVSLH